MIRTLTPEHERQLTAYRERCVMAALCTDPADRDVTERAIFELYIAADLRPPRYEWVGSPGRAVSENKFDDSQWTDPHVFPSGAYVQFMHAYINYCSDTIFSRVSSAFIGTAVADLRFAIFKQIFLGSDIGPRAGSGGTYGQHEADWTFRAVFLRDVLGVPCESRMSRCLDLLCALARSAGWWYPGRGKVICCERPSSQSVNERGAIHCDDAPAVEFRDGFKVWALDGHVVDETLVMRPEAQILGHIHTEANAELRRIRIERYAGRGKATGEGWKRYLRDLCAECVDRRRNDMENVEEALFRSPMLTEAVLICTCPSTGRVYGLQVPGTCGTVAEAQQWLHSRSSLDDLGTSNVIGRS